MTAYLVLVRHGQAQTRSAALADEHRHLTEAGARAFRVTWEQALPMLPAADVAVVSSTYDRAEETAAIAAWHSKGRASSNVPVDYTRVRYVKKPSGSKPGMVIFTHNRTLYVEPKLP